MHDANELCLFWAKVLFTIVSHSYRNNVFSYDAVLGRDSNLLPDLTDNEQMRYVLRNFQFSPEKSTNINTISQ